MAVGSLIKYGLQGETSSKIVKSLSTVLEIGYVVEADCLINWHYEQQNDAVKMRKNSKKCF